MEEEMGEAKELQGAAGDSVKHWRECCALMGQGSACAEGSQPRSESSVRSWDHVLVSLATFLTASSARFAF